MAAAPAAAGKGTVKAMSGVKTDAVLYSQNDNDGGTGVTSQNFEASFDIYDNSGADDFKVPKGTSWKVSSVDVTGVYYNGSGPAASEHVTFYADAGGLPGAAVADFPASAGTDSGGSFSMPVKAKLKKGTYWVGVQANMDFAIGGQWGWEVRSVQAGNGAAWQNPGDGFGSGCTTWGSLQTCLGYGPDFMFALNGKAK
ncbi:MAG: hypothetical protein U1F53_14875 [Burkholderiaceae bacterium]